MFNLQGQIFLPNTGWYSESKKHGYFVCLHHYIDCSSEWDPYSGLICDLHGGDSDLLVADWPTHPLLSLTWAGALLREQTSPIDTLFSLIPL